jgi:hypothetical protein
VRIHKLTTGRKLWLIDGGFPIAYTRKSTLEQIPAREPGPIVRGPNGASLMRSLLGEQLPECAELGANSSLLSSLTAMPLLRSTHEAGHDYWLASLVAGSNAREDNFLEALEYSVQIDGEIIRILRKQEPWWSSETEPTGRSSSARLAELSRRV